MERQIALCDLTCNPGFLPHRKVVPHCAKRATEVPWRLFPPSRIDGNSQQGTVGQGFRQVGLLSRFERCICKLTHETFEPGRRPCLERRLDPRGTAEMQAQTLDHA